MVSSPFRSLPANVWLLAASQALAMCAVPMMILVSGLLAIEIAPNAKLATLPIALIVVGTASSTVPVAMAMKRLGRKRGGYIGFSAGLLSCLCGYLASTRAEFGWLLCSSYLLGVSTAFGQQFRFAALESVKDPQQYGPAISAFMTGGLIAAVVGPEIGARGRDLVASPYGFAGSFVLMSGAIVLAASVFSFFKEPKVEVAKDEEAARPAREIARSPLFWLAAMTAAISYGVMSFVMTATPITMYEVCGFTLQETKQVIQSHILAMYLPSLFSGWLMKRMGAGRLMAAGAVGYGVVLVVGLQGQALMHFWLSLIVLGVGWNFLFASGTALLPRSYRPSERFKAQAMNDLTVFGSQAVASLSAGWFLFSYGWTTLLWSCVPFIVGAGVLAFWQRRLEKGNK